YTTFVRSRGSRGACGASAESAEMSGCGGSSAWGETFLCPSTAFLTRMRLQSTSMPLSARIAALASPGTGILANPKPLEPRVNGSMTTTQDCTLPWFWHSANSVSAVVLLARLRNMIFKMRSRHDDGRLRSGGTILQYRG